jgi:cell division protein FtsL
LLVALFIAILASAVATVRIQHLRRGLFAELQTLEQRRDALELDWSKLLLERSAWTSHDRIRRLARERLALELPRADELVLVLP